MGLLLAVRSTRPIEEYLIAALSPWYGPNSGDRGTRLVHGRGACQRYPARDPIMCYGPG